MLGVIINYCSNERRFIEKCIEQCSLVTSDIIVSYGSHLYDGTPEVFDATLVTKYPHVKFIQYQVDLEIPAENLEGVVKRPTAYWCNLARWQGLQALPLRAEWVLFLDADEIPEGDALKLWLNQAHLDDKSIYKLANYWYFKEETNQATVWEDSILLVPRKHLTRACIFHDDERDGIIKVCGLRQNRMVIGPHCRPMIHHYSWVRSKEGLVKKLKTWAHRDDIFSGADAEGMVNYIYKDDEVNDIVHNYDYIQVIPPFS